MKSTTTATITPKRLTGGKVHKHQAAAAAAGRARHTPPRATTHHWPTAPAPQARASMATAGAARFDNKGGP